MRILALILALASLTSHGLGAEEILSIGQDGEISISNFTQDGSFAKNLVHLILLLTVMSIAPSILVVVTSFTRIVVVFSLLRTAIGLQQAPPSNVLVALALFLTGFVMFPTLKEAYVDGLQPVFQGEITYEESFNRTAAPFRRFMLGQVQEQDLVLFSSIGQVEVKIEELEKIPLQVLIPAFILGELRRAFEIGFLIFVPFLIIDMAVASILMAMGMMMLPPVVISLPFKLIFFVLIDGWNLLVDSLVRSFQTPSI